MKPVRKAVFPVAGLGTRFLPATKAVPKEMLPVVDKPLIQYAVDEARAAGIEQIIFVTGRGKNAIEDYFDIAYEPEATLTARDKHDAGDARRQPARLRQCRLCPPAGAFGPRPRRVVRPRHRSATNPSPCCWPTSSSWNPKSPCLQQMREAYEAKRRQCRSPCWKCRTTTPTAMASSSRARSRAR